MNVLRHELSTSQKSLLVWSISLSVVVILFLSMYPTFSKDVADSQKVLANLPLPVRKALGISLGNFFTLFGFYGYVFTFVTLAGALQAMTLGISIFSKEYARKTADFLLTRPISRTSIITQKLIAELIILTTTNIVFGLAAFLAVHLYTTESFSLTVFALITLTLFFVQLVFLSIGMIVAAVVMRIKNPVAVSLPTVTGFFIVSSLSAIFDQETVKYLTPFKFFDTTFIIKNHHYDYPLFAWCFVVTGVCILLSYVVYNKKDIS